MDAPVHLKGLSGTDTLWFDGEKCRQCGKPATHYWLRQVEPDKWSEQRQMTFLATAYCTACGPSIEDWERARAAHQPWWRRVLTTIKQFA